jgi:hypothetical protein
MMMTAKASLVRPTGMTSPPLGDAGNGRCYRRECAARALTLTPVLLLDEGRNFVRVADYKLVRAGHASGLSPAGIWMPDHRSSTS